MAYYRLGGTVSPRMQVLGAVIFFATIIMVGAGFWLVYQLFGYVPRRLIGIVLFLVCIFFMVMTAILRKDVKYDAD
jgi:fatty acid desaturase